MKPLKPIGKKNYGSIPHLIGSKLGVGDHHITEGQHNILTKKTRDKHDFVIVTEKYDGSNVGIAKHQGKIIALTRKGYLAESSPFEQHHYFAKWVEKHKSLFDDMLSEGDRIVGEWLLMAHGLKYRISQPHPIVFFDYFRNCERLTYKEFSLILDSFPMLSLPTVYWFMDCAISPKLINESVSELPEWTYHRNPLIEVGGGLEREGLVYRCERKGKVDFLAKWVRSDFEAGKYFAEKTGGETVWNFSPEHL